VDGPTLEAETPKGEVIFVRPMACVWPEVTEEEAGLLNEKTVAIAERRARAIRLYRERKAMSEIARELGVSSSTVHADIHVVLDGYKRLAQRSASELLADWLQQLAWREQQIEQAWLESRNREESEANERTNAQTGAKHKTATVKRTKIAPSEVYARLLLEILQLRARYWGLLANDGDSGDIKPPPVKLVAGIDPMSLV